MQSELFGARIPMLIGKFRVSRLMRASLWGSAKDPVNKRNYGPGQHGRNPSRRVSNFNRQNAAQRAFRSYYNIGKRQFSNIFYRAYKGKGNTNDNLVAVIQLVLAFYQRNRKKKSIKYCDIAY